MKKSLLYLCCALTTASLAQDNFEWHYTDSDEPFEWVRIYQADPFDDTVYARGVVYYDVPKIEETISNPFIPTQYDYSKLTLFGIFRETATDNSPCSTYINVLVPSDDLSEHQLKNNSLSFNFKGFKTFTIDTYSYPYKVISSDPIEDLKILNLKVDRRDIWSNQDENGTRMYYASEVKKILTAMLDSTEMRVRVQFDDTYFNLKARLPRKVDSNAKYDDKGKLIESNPEIISQFEEKWKWVTELCEDSAVDLTEDDKASDY